jgi:hypothetical protein
VSAKAGWYPDPGGGAGLYRYWDGRSWSAATTANPASPPPSAGLGAPAETTLPYGSGSGSGHGGYGTGQPNAYANYQQIARKKSPIGWWIGAAALLVVIIVVAVVAIRSISGGGGGLLGNPPASQPSEDVCPKESTASPSPLPHPNDGRVHGGPVSYPELGPPWGAPQGDNRVPFGSDVASQLVLVEPNYQPGSNWVASILVGELQAGDGFYTPEQGAQIVVKCILGRFYGDNPVNSDVQKNQAATIDGHDGWIVESHLTFDIKGLKTKGELLIVAIVSTGATAGLYYASIPDTTPDLVAPARQCLAQLKVDG